MAKDDAVLQRRIKIHAMLSTSEKLLKPRHSINVEPRLFVYFLK